MTEIKKVLVDASAEGKVIDPTVLRTLCEQATPGEWTAMMRRGGGVPSGHPLAVVIRDGQGRWLGSFDWSSCGNGERFVATEEEMTANGELAIAGRNNLLKLLDENAALRAERDEMDKQRRHWLRMHDSALDEAQALESRLAALTAAGRLGFLTGYARAEGERHFRDTGFTPFPSERDVFDQRAEDAFRVLSELPVEVAPPLFALLRSDPNA